MFSEQTPTKACGFFKKLIHDKRKNSSLRSVTTSVTKRFHLTSFPPAQLTFNSSTRSILFFPSGLMSLRIKAMMISIPFDSWVAMQFWRSSRITMYHKDESWLKGGEYFGDTAACCLPDFRDMVPGSTLWDSPRFGWWEPRSFHWCTVPAGLDRLWCFHKYSLRTAGSHTPGCSCSCCSDNEGSSEEIKNL